jgi:hypothetical protein
MDTLSNRIDQVKKENAPMPKRETPTELAKWMEERAELLMKAAQRIKTNSDTRHGQPVGEWLLPLLKDLASVQTISMRAIYLLSTYALRTGATTQTEVAKATDVTVTAAGNRAASRVAREVWAEVWPEKR